jgi:hypothetical protein
MHLDTFTRHLLLKFTAANIEVGHKYERGQAR